MATEGRLSGGGIGPCKRSSTMLFIEVSHTVEAVVSTSASQVSPYDGRGRGCGSPRPRGSFAADRIGLREPWSSVSLFPLSVEYT